MHKRASRVPTYLSRLPTLMWVEIQSNQLLTEVASSRICLMTANPGLRYTEYDHRLRVDTVENDVGQIIQSIKETASAGQDDVNSVVQLAALKPANVPDTKTISNETKILMSAIQNLERRFDNFGYYYNDTLDVGAMAITRPSFEINDGNIIFSGGGTARIGEKIYHNGTLVGILNKIDQKNKAILIMDNNRYRKYLQNDPKVAEFDSIPF